MSKISSVAELVLEVYPVIHLKDGSRLKKTLQVNPETIKLFDYDIECVIFTRRKRVLCL